jgi:hypothetical protein
MGNPGAHDEASGAHCQFSVRKKIYQISENFGEFRIFPSSTSKPNALSRLQYSNPAFVYEALATVLGESADALCKPGHDDQGLSDQNHFLGYICS